jgi:membrane-bound lytic murein transglycosylase B
MSDLSRRRRLGGHRSAGRAAALATAACLLVSCSDPAPEDVGGPDAGVSAGSAPPGATSGTSPSGRPEALASQLDRAVATLRDPDATTAEQRRAGELQQLAVRALAQGSDRFERRVTGRLDHRTALVTRASVRASRLLGAMTAPQPRLPPWRIVAPPPPGELLDDYRAAQRRTGVPWTYLAAINLVETRMGRIRGTSTAGARGPMQFIPATWAAYGAGGDVNDPGDAILGAARLLKANGAPGDMAGALWHYNQSSSYVRAVSAYAHSMQVADWAYRGYWHWRVLYSQRRGTYVLPVGYPDSRAVLLPGH